MMEGANADSDHSMTWEDFFGSTTDLAPSLICIYDSLLEPTQLNTDIQTAKDARNDPPVDSPAVANDDNPIVVTKTEEIIKEVNKEMRVKDPTMLAGSVKLPIASVNKSALYSIRTKSDSDGKCSDIKRTREKTDVTLSPNVQRIISSAGETSTLKFAKKTGPSRASTRFKSNIPLVGATSKISQSGVEIISSVDIYDKPCLKNEKPVKPDVKIDATYDVPTNNAPIIYDVPTKKTAFETLSLPFIDQSIELSITCDREFDTKLPSKETSPQKSPPKVPPRKHSIPSPVKYPKSNSLHRKDFNPKQLAKSGPYPETIGSTGNLKSFVPEKERLNPSIEVTRPLSMSSIASSSSTSSSGVQNKGVNSAYLASIESLDDHSDVDMSANGSNNFVNSTGVLNNSSEQTNSGENSSRQHIPEEMSGLSQLERVCSEIVQTENVYVEDLRQVVEGYLHVWRKQNTFSEEELTDLFNNIEDIYAFNRSLCEALNSCKLDATCIARCFVDNTSGFSVYTSYCTGYPRTMQRLAALASNQESAREFRERQVDLGHLLPLASYLLKPVQRILKYHLLLQNVVKQCASNDTEYALLKMTGIAHHIDDMKRKHEHAVRVQEIQSLLYGWNGPDLTTYGELCAEGTFRVFGAKAMRHVFLFDKMLLVTKNREDGILAYKSHIMCNNLMLVESIAGAGLSFHVIPWDAPRDQLTLQARSRTHKREWTLLLKRVILENYNAVIPSHARQLVMELGQNKTDDDMLAEKSHSLITQASMRKQLSAPEYLEKRKIDRERRKSFENGLRSRLKKTRKLTNRQKNCDCIQISNEKGVDYTCDNCYIDLCSDCENELNKNTKCLCKQEVGQKCPECDKTQYTDNISTENLERKCKCEFKSSQESFNLDKTRDYNSSESIAFEDPKNLKINKTCLKCEKIKENIVIDTGRPSRCIENDKHQSIRSKSKDDPQRSKLSKIGNWRRKSEPGLQQNIASVIKKCDSDSDRNEARGSEKIEFECRNCGSNKITRKRNDTSDPESEKRGLKPNLEIRMYNSKNIPKKISKIKKSRAKLRLTDTTTKFYADLSTDISNEILHISESNDSLNIDKTKETISKDEDIDEETYKKLIEKTDSFKKNELEKVKYLNKQKVINEGSEAEDRIEGEDKKIDISCEETEQPLEQIISQLLMQNREFQKLVKKQQQRNSAQRRHQRLLKSHSNPEHTIISKFDTKLKYGRQTSENLDLKTEIEIAKPLEEDHIYETLRVDNRIDENLHNIDNKSKIIQRPKRLQSPNPIIINSNDLGPESDYVYLSFDKLNQNEDGIYDIPVKSPQKVEQNYYVTMENPKNDNIYDSLIEVCKRKKDESADYLPMSPESPNTPEIWLSRQKEHFNITRDRKSGSLPRSFQVVTTTDENLTTFKSNSYVNRDGKLKTDRPYTIASDQSEISYDEEREVLKFNNNKNDGDLQNISQSTLELEEEIDRCYKNNFEVIDLDKNKIPNTQPNLDASITSSCEILSIENNEPIDIIHPEHKIYKPTTNGLSLKNVLNRFKKTKHEEENVDSNEIKLEKSPNEKRSALNPRSYSKNLLQRFRSIIGDEHCDEIDTQNKLDINSTDLTKPNEILSKSVCETKPEKDIHLSQSCDNIKEITLERSASTVSSVLSADNSPIKSSNQKQKLPIYMQGSKHLGARIAQSDYADPTTLINEKSHLKAINLLRNKNSIRPDSLFSNSSFVTTSSDGHVDSQKKIKELYTDESFYEKSFEKIENIQDEDVFRDSAVYSDQEDEKLNTSKVNTKVENVTRLRSQVTITSVTETNIPINKSDEKKSKIAPPVPAKPKLSQIPSSFKPKTNLSEPKTNPIRSESTPNDAQIEKPELKSEVIDKYQGIQIKRLSFERASLDSATRKIKNNEIKKPIETQKTVKSVFERRMEIESMSKPNLKKPSLIEKPKSITNKMAAFEKVQEKKVILSPSSSTDRANVSNTCAEVQDDLRGSWVKQVVNKFQ